MVRVFLLALWMAPSAASATRIGALSSARQPVRPAVLRRPIVLRRTTVLTSSLQDQQIFRATIDEIAQLQDAFIQQLPVDGAISRDDARMLEALERALNANRHALDALSNYQTAPTAPPAPAQAPVPIPPRQLGLPPGSVTPPRCSPTMQYSQYRGQRQGSVEEQDYGHQQGCEQGYEVQGMSRQDFGEQRYGVGPTWAPPASAVVTGPSYDKGGREVGPRFTP